MVMRKIMTYVDSRIGHETTVRNAYSERQNMKQQLMRLRSVGALAFGGLLLIASNGVSAQGVPGKFPDMNSATLKGGTFVSIENLRNVGNGLTKKQMYALLGPPHFHEGVFGVKAWNYIFNFRRGSEIVTCQYQVQYDEKKLVSGAYWDRQECADFLKEEPAPVPLPVEKVAPAPVKNPQHYELAADTLFDFGQSSIQHLHSNGRDDLDKLIDKIKADNSVLTQITATGHTDRVGSVASNMRLSLARAATVRDYFVTHGIDGKLIKVTGVGASQPVAVCPPGNGVAVIACLQPNRRVTLDVDGEQR
jgi:outer membrane protein OmpA-like peptidoglycan-associated protein